MKHDKIGNYDMYLDFSLIRTKLEKTAPEIKTEQIEIEGGNGKLDLTEYFGDVTYTNGLLKLEYEIFKNQRDYNELYSEILNKIHGKKMKIIPHEESEFYYVGRVKVNPWQSDKLKQKIAFDVDTEPFKYKNDPTVISKTINGTTQVTCPNLRKPVVPIITITAAATIVFKTYSNDGVLEGEYRRAVSAGSYPHTFIQPEIQFKEGDNILEVTMNGAVTIEYQEGAL